MIRAVSRAAFANPFAAEREQIDREVVGASGTASRAEVLDALIRKVKGLVDSLRSRGLLDLRRHGSRDVDGVRLLFLFEMFHRLCPQFDQLVKDQLQRGDELCEVSFAAPAIEELVRDGLSVGDAERAFAVFFQLRRAYHFIAEGLVGSSQAMRGLREQLWQNVFTNNVGWYHSTLWSRMEDFSTLLLGETGTGKGTAAAAIGRSAFIPYDSRRGRFKESFTRAFVSLNLSQFPEALLESELFGHKKGAFTGAVDQHEGVLSRCSRYGAAFLDEIGDVGLPVQIKLLQVLQERSFCPVGSHDQKRFEGRIIAATNQRLLSLREKGVFRDDFYYRLCSDEIVVPPLRERLAQDPGEMGQLVTHLLKRQCGRDYVTLLSPVLSALKQSPGPAYAWPGNVRELEQAIRRILIRGRYLPVSEPTALAVSDLFSKARADGWDARRLLSGYCKSLYEASGNYGQVARSTGLDWRTVKRYVRELEDNE